MKVLFLSEWYPHRYDAMAGLFVQKHAVAVAGQGVDVCVLYLHHDRHIRRRDISDRTYNGVREITVYYPGCYISALLAGWRYVRRHWGSPDICQLNVITKNALLPLWLKWRYGTPYVIVEHWTGYLPENMSVRSMSLYTRCLQFFCRQAEVVMPVSQKLKEAMLSLGFKAKQWRTIDNVVDDFFFKKTVARDSVNKTILNITCFDEPHKNVKALLRAAEKLSQKREDWQLVIVGTGVDFQEVRAYADSLHLHKNALLWTGEQTPRQVADWFSKADVFVLSSRYETYGVVYGEAVASGVPIVSTPVGIAEELPSAIVPQDIVQHNPECFAEYIEQALWRAKSEPVDYSVYSKRFSSTEIGNKLKSVYEKICTT